MIRSNKIFLLMQMSLLLAIGRLFILEAYADDGQYIAAEELTEKEKEVESALEKTLEYNFSPDDRARLRKALADYARNTDPEHVQIEKKRKAMKISLEERFNQCNNDVDDSLNRQEVTECLPQVARHFNTVDVDVDHVITLEELELAQAKWTERHKAAEARVEAQRIKEAEAQIKQKSKAKNKNRQASSKGKQPS